MESRSDLFSVLEHAGHVPHLEKLDGTVRFDIDEGTTTRHVLVAIKRGDITVSEQMSPADCVIHGDRALFESTARGEVNMMAAVLRGAITVEGDPRFAVMLQRLLPGSTADRKTTSAKKRKSK